MLTVYLDQNKWIDLARAESGHPQGARFIETLAVLKAAADEGRARFPLRRLTTTRPGSSATAGNARSWQPR